MEERGRNKGDRAIVHQTHAHPAAADVDDLRREAGIGPGFIVEETGVQPVGDVALGHPVETTALRHLHGGFILGTRNGLAFNDGFQQTVVDHVAILTDRRGPGGIGFKPKTKVWARLGADFRKRLEAANAAVEETGRLSVQFPAQLAEPFQGEHFRRVDVHIMGFQQGGQLLGVRRIETGMNVINAEAELVAQNAGGTDVGGDHRLFDNAVGNATRFRDDIQHFAFFAENETVVRTVFEHQRMGLTPFATTLAHVLQQRNLLRDRLAVRLPAAAAFQPVRDVVIGQLGFRFDGGSKELDIVFDGAIGRQGHPAGQHRAHFVSAQGAEVVRQLARQHWNVEARQIVGKGAHFCGVIQLAAFGNPGGRVGNGDRQQQFAISSGFGIQRIVHIFGAGAVNGDEVEGG